MPRKPPKPLHVYLIAAARKTWYWSPHRRAAIAAASVGPDLVRCASCQKLLPKSSKKGQRKLYAVDHIEPLVPTDKKSPTLEKEPNTDSFGWDTYLRRLMFGALQVLCHPCHAAKTKKENRERKQKRL